MHVHDRMADDSGPVRRLSEPRRVSDEIGGNYPLDARCNRRYLSFMGDVTCFTVWASAVAALAMRLPKTVSIISRSVLSLMLRGTVRLRFFLGA